MLPDPAFDAIQQARDAVRGMASPWGICGGWAIDLWLGRKLREHGDVDIAVLRRDQAALRRLLEAREWTLTIASDGRERPWRADEELAAPEHSVWCRRADRPGVLEVLLNEAEGTDFVFRRDPAMRMPMGRAWRASPSGVPVLSPAIVLLYKSKSPDAASTAEFAAAAASLEPEDRDWLRRGLARQRPDHPWLRNNNEDGPLRS